LASKQNTNAIHIVQIILIQGLEEGSNGEAKLKLGGAKLASTPNDSKG
jgi:hypothetical protein